MFTALGAWARSTPTPSSPAPRPHDADDRIIYDQATGNLYYDADGNGAGAADPVRNAAGPSGIAASDFQVI